MAKYTAHDIPCPVNESFRRGQISVKRWLTLVESGRGKRFYEFGPFRLDAQERGVAREGCPVTLTPKAFTVLLELVRSGGRIVGRDELMRRVWPDSFVEEGNLKVTIFNLRKALEEDPAAPLYIQTVPRRGYRLGAQVVEKDECDTGAVEQKVEAWPATRP